MAAMMNLDAALEAARTGSRGDRLIAATTVGELLEEGLSAPGALREASTQVAETAQRYGYRALLGASPVGDRLAAAAVALAADGLFLYRGPDDGPVLIVDGVLVTGVQLAAAARRVREDGVSRAGGAVLLAVNDIDLAPILETVIVLGRDLDI